MARNAAAEKVVSTARSSGGQSFCARMAENEAVYSPKPAKTVRDLTLGKAFPPAPPKE